MVTASNKECDDDDIMSPVLTAQERKRMIIERRRRADQQQNMSLQQSSSVESVNFSAPSSPASSLPTNHLRSIPQLTGNRDLHGESMVAPLSVLHSMTNSLFTNFSQGGDLRRSKRPSLSRRPSSSASRLFIEETLHTQPHANSTSGGTLPPPIEQSLSCASSGQPNAASFQRKSLFGAVMQLATTPTPARNSVTIAQEKTLSDSSAPPVQPDLDFVSSPTRTRANKLSTPARVMWDDVTSPSRASQKNHRTYDKSVMASPGGFGLLNVLNNVMSPFYSRESPVKKRKRSGPSTPNTPVTLVKNRFEEWHEAFLNLDGEQMGIWDWSIKRRLRIECHPGTCLPGSLVGSNGSYVQSRAMRQFLTEISATKSNKRASSPNVDDCRVQWESGLMYWQHPAVHPLPQSVLIMQSRKGSAHTTGEESSSSAKAVVPAAGSSKEIAKASNFGKDTNSVVQQSSKYVLSQLTDTVRGPNARIPKFVRRKGKGLLGGLGAGFSDPNALIEHRKREWQEAFRSLYFGWIQQVGDLPAEIHASRKAAAQVYFYSIQKGQVVLFRPGIDSSSDTDRIVPMIILSSTNKKLRSSLESMGVNLTLLHKPSKDVEKMLPSKLEQKEDEEDEVTLKAELEALRKAQSDGVTAGADVSVSMRFRKASSDKKGRNSSPMYVSGEGNCAVFFELYLNSFGSITGSPIHDEALDVPLLLCRKIGPFLHSSVKNIAVTSRREDYHHEHLSKANNKDTQHHAAVEIRGPILPCAVQELLCASAARMTLDHKERESKKGSAPEISSATTAKHKADEDAVGSHYFVLEVQTHEGEESSQLVNNGTPGSAWFNAEDSHTDDAGGGKSTAWHQCGQSEVMNMAVWDVARPAVISYKIGPSSSVALHATTVASNSKKRK